MIGGKGRGEVLFPAPNPHMDLGALPRFVPILPSQPKVPGVQKRERAGTKLFALTGESTADPRPPANLAQQGFFDEQHLIAPYGQVVQL